MRADDLREEFLSFFEKQERGHKRVPSSPLVPENDPSLMFTNSGMVQFKNVFTGLEKRDYKRAVTAQRCLRAGGKHNDLENVGYTKRHHTFFEMLGNFSFGDYFKEEAIVYAWEFLTKELELDKDKLIATVYHEDKEALELWKKFLPKKKIIEIPTSDNFWQMGDSGPCGPCSEIFYLNGEKGEKGEVDGVEVWNLVFMQYDLQKGKRTPLPEPCVDTGMGLERMLAVLEGERDNYDTSLFAPSVKIICDKLELQDSVFANNSKQRSSIKVIADHVRACIFMLGDGIIPSNEGRGYVLRRILRRAMRHIHKIDGREPMFREIPIFYEIAQDIISPLAKNFPELRLKSRAIVRTIENEEERFCVRLARGLRLLRENIDKIPKSKILKGKDAFILYDTYGFPLDLTEDTLREQGINVDRKGFNTAMEQQRMHGRAAWVGSGEKVNAAVWFSIAASIEYAVVFEGDETNSLYNIEIEEIVKDGNTVDVLNQGEKGILIFQRTPFYAESGGQRGDCGSVVSSLDNSRFEVTDTQYAHSQHLILHHGYVRKGKLERGNAMVLEVDPSHRRPMEIHHSATHLLHAALREVLGSQTQQKGSQITPEKLRFDFNHNTPLTEDDLKNIEKFVNQRCLEALPIIAEKMSRDEAKEKNAIALFGEKYGETVRVVTIEDKRGNPLHPTSVELCGGTHVKTTAVIGKFHIISENSIASGVRRIEAVAGDALLDMFKDREKEKEKQLDSLREQNKKLQAELKQARESLLLQRSTKNGKNEMVRNLGNLSPKDLKPLANRILQQQKLPAIALASLFEGKISLLLALSPQTALQHSAVHLLEPAQKILRAQGGGKPALAQIGSSHTDKLPEALKQLERSLQNIKP